MELSLGLTSSLRHLRGLIWASNTLEKLSANYS